jgi:FG-GAP-like repeat
MDSRVPRIQACVTFVALLIAVSLVVTILWGLPSTQPQGPSQSKVDYPGLMTVHAAAGPNQLIIADLNLDKVMDIVTANSTDNSISIVKGIGNGTFHDPVRLTVSGRTPYWVTSARLNEDSYPDLVTANVGSANLSVFMSDGHGGYRDPMSVATDAGPIVVAAGDLDNRGRDDLATLNEQQDSVNVFFNNSEHTFNKDLSLRVNGKMPVAMLIADVNNDGKRDIITANNESGNVSVLLNQGHRTFSSSQEFATGAGPVAICAGDFNGDGLLDLATANEAPETVTVLMNKGNGTFARVRDYPVKHPLSIVAADVNGDKKMDLIVSERNSNFVTVLLNNGDGSFGEPIHVALWGAHIMSLAVADMNHDGKADIVGADFVTGDVAILLQGIRVPHVQSVSPAAKTKILPEATGLSEDLHINFNTDLDPKTLNADTVFVYGAMSGYHRADISYSASDHSVIVRPKGSLAFKNKPIKFQTGETVNVILTNKIRSSAGIPMKYGYTATFSVQPRDGTGDFKEVQRMNCVKIPGRLRVADMDNDGHVDLVALCREVDSVRLHFNDGHGHFETEVTLPTRGNGPWDLWPADLNRDGLMDIAVVNTFTSDLVLFYNRGGRKFDPVKIPSAAGPMGVVAADLNGDGWLDLITVMKGVPEVEVYINDGKGGFLKPVSYPVAPSPYHITARDINGDGAVDLLMTNLESDRGTILLNNGDGTFRSPQEFPLLLAKALTDDPVDVNQDGMPDMVTVNTASDDISVFTNEGGGKFKEQVKYAVGASPTDQIFGDFNGDGYPDVAVTLDGGKVALLMNNGDGTFKKGAELQVGKNPTSPVAADFDENGTLDLVIANQYSHDISIFMNPPKETLAKKK